MKQILFIHGGDSFRSQAAYLADLKARQMDYTRLLPKQRWTNTLAAEFPAADILLPTMPNSANAQFDEWAIWFEKILPFLDPSARIIGHSLGAMFLAKYLHQKPLAQPVAQLHLVAGGYDDPSQDYGSFKVDSATGLEKSTRQIFLYHSEDDPVVPYSELAKFEKDLPAATVCRFSTRNHFLDPEFPEIIENLKK